VTTPLIRLERVIKNYAGLRPLRVASLALAAADRVVLSGLDEGAAEMFVHLVTGAALPDEGQIAIAGRETSAISTDIAWLESLDRFGLVTHRAVLLDSLPVRANLALPLTMAIEDPPDEVRARVGEGADAAGLVAGRLDVPAHALSAEERLRVHLARAVITRPQFVLLEHPTAVLADRARAAAFGATLAAASAQFGFGWLAISEDEAFADATRASRMRLDPALGRVASPRAGWLGWFRR
jgi:ABC-type ATPase involved in cell division